MSALIFFGFFLLVLLFIFAGRRSRRKTRLAGLTSARPVYSTTPPGGFVGDRLKDGAL